MIVDQNEHFHLQERIAGYQEVHLKLKSSKPSSARKKRENEMLVIRVKSLFLLFDG